MTRLGWQLRYAVYVIGFVSLVLAAALFVLLMCVSARRPNTKELYPGFLHRVPYDLLAAVCFVACACAVAALGYVEPDELMLLLAVPVRAVLGGVLLGVIESLAKAYISTQLSNSILFAFLIIVLLVRPSGLLGKYVPEKV